MGVVSRMRVESMGVASGCGCIDFFILLIPTPPVFALFCSSIPTFLFILKCFLFLFLYFLVIKFYVLNNFPPQYKHTYGRIWAAHGSHMKVAHNVLYTKKHTQTNASYSAMDISCMLSKGDV